MNSILWEYLNLHSFISNLLLLLVIVMIQNLHLLVVVPCNSWSVCRVSSKTWFWVLKGLKRLKLIFGNNQSFESWNEILLFALISESEIWSKSVIFLWFGVVSWLSPWGGSLVIWTKRLWSIIGVQTLWLNFQCFHWTLGMILGLGDVLVDFLEVLRVAWSFLSYW